MPPVRRPRVYADANVLLAYVSDEEHRADVVQSVLDDARNDRVGLFTSVLSITEVAYIATGDTDSPSSERRIDQLWTPASPISVIDFSQRAALQARSIIRRARSKGLRGVRSADAIHLASAELQECSQFFTYEKKTTREQWDSLISATVSEPYTESPQLGFQ